MSNYLSPLNTKLDSEQVLKRSYDETKNRIRVDADVTATVGVVDVVIDAASGDNIAISDGTNTMLINPDGSINANVDVILSHIDDSVRLGNGTNFFSSSQRETGEIGLDTNVLNRVFSKPFDELEVTSKNDDGDPLVIVSRLNASIVQTVTLVYDVDGDFQKLTVT